MLEIQYIPSANRQIDDLLKTDPDLVADMMHRIDYLSEQGMSALKDMPRVYKQLHRTKKFNLYEIVVKQQRTAFVILRTNKGKIYIIHIFKKQRGRESKEIKIAIRKARKL